MKVESDKEKFGNRVGKVADLVGGQAELSRRTGISKVTIASYIAGNSEPSRERLIAMANAAEVSLLWLSIGEGTMLIGQETLNEEPSLERRGEKAVGPVFNAAIHAADHAVFDTLGMVEGMGLLTEIYSSGDIVYIRAINANLMAFSDAVKTKAKASSLAETIHQIQDQMLQMRDQINELKTEVLCLRNENSDLKRELRSRSCNEPDAATG